MGGTLVSKKTSITLLFSAALLTVIVALFFDPIPQPQAYHAFADDRSWLGIPNAWNVLSNVSFALVGVWGLLLLFTPENVKFIDHRERFMWVGVSIGLLLTAIGSSYYHLAPDNYRLVWDRLPMTIVFMSAIAALIGERISINLGLWLWPALLAVGFLSVFLWYKSELSGMGDLRFYVGLQVFTILVILVMLITRSPYTRTYDLIIVILLYALAFLFETYDHQINIFTRDIITGHALKHFAAALAGLWLLRMVAKRKIKKEYT